ncbi:RDD family protein [Actinoplanes sp. NPDC048796]|uniref:RDD family protein n=1 Tax=unclassified Actinoplanes TaxID=2626549 RepID=UPI003408A42B
MSDTGLARPVKVYAGPVSRLIAYVIDALIVTGFGTAAIAVLALVGELAGFLVRETQTLLATTFALALPAVFGVYCAVFWLLAGRTPGMALLGLRVVTAGGRPVGWLAALVRGLVLGYFPIGAAWILVDRRHQAIHDKIARTAVLRLSPE